MADDNVVYRVGQLEDDVKGIQTDVKEILINHLPHINEELVKNGVKLDGFTALFKWQYGILACVIGAIIISAILS